MAHSPGERGLSEKLPLDAWAPGFPSAHATPVISTGIFPDRGILGLMTRELTDAEVGVVATTLVAAAKAGDMDEMGRILAAAGPETTVEVAAVLAAALADRVSAREAAAAVQLATAEAMFALPDTTEAALIEAAVLEAELRTGAHDGA